MKNIRIPVDLAQQQSRINFRLDQDFDNLEILSLKLSAYDVYSQMTSDFGVVVGRVNVNGGFGVQNAKVSVFIPIDSDDSLREEILQLYPFKGVADKMTNGVRYNLFPRTKQSNISHQPVGNFPDVTDLTYYPTYLEIYEKYYKFTTTTNGSGDYMIFGVPLGNQQLHMDFDLFDTKSFYITADDLVTEIKTSSTISAQLSSELTQAINPDFVLSTGGTYSVKLKADLDAMPNIFSDNKTVNVVPFWGDKTLHDIGITRCDFEINYQYVPTAILFGSVINSNFWSNSIGYDYKTSNATRIQEQSAAVDLKVIAYKHITDWQVERYAIYSAVPGTGDSTNGVFILSLPMFQDYYITDEFGQLVPSPPNEDGTPSTRGVPTKGRYVFEFFDDNESIYGGNGRRDPGSTVAVYETDPAEWRLRNYWANVTPGIRVPANQNGHYYLGGWATNNYAWNQTLFEYDILAGKPKFYTVSTKFHKHSSNDLRVDGEVIEYLPIIDSANDFNIPIDKSNPGDITTLNGCLFAPRFLIQDDWDRGGVKLAHELAWTPWFDAEFTGNYYVQPWDWIYGIGVKHLEGKNRGEGFSELYGDTTGSMKQYVDMKTWYFGDNPLDAANPPTPNFYAQLLAQKADATGRNINSVHNRFNLAVTPEFTAGLFVSSIVSGASKILYETSVEDVTDIMPDLISNGVYSSYNKHQSGEEPHTFQGKKYLFGTHPLWQNALYTIKQRYFNE